MKITIDNLKKYYWHDSIREKFTNSFPNGIDIPKNAVGLEVFDENLFEDFEIIFDSFKNHGLMFVINKLNKISFNKNGNIEYKIYDGKIVEERLYNSSQKLIEIDYKNGLSAFYKYDKNGFLSKAILDDEVIELENDDNGNVLLKIVTYGNIKIISKYKYDSRGNIIYEEDNGRHKVEYEYDDFDNMTAMIENGNINRWTFNQDSIPITRTWPDGDVEILNPNRKYDSTGIKWHFKQ